MKADLRDTTEFAAVAEHLRRLHEPAFGRPHALREPEVSRDGTRVAVTGLVFDRLAGHPRTGIYTGDGELRPVSAGTGSARSARFAPDGSALAFLADRATPGEFQLFLLRDNDFGEAVGTPTVPGTVEYAHWSPDGRHILLGVAGLGADLSGGQGSGTITTATDAPAADWLPEVDTGATEDAWRGLWLYTVETGAVRRISPDGLNCWEAGWAGPAGVLAIASDDPSEDSWYGAALHHIDPATGTSRELLRSEVQLGLPAGSPDGRYAAIAEAVCSDRWILAGELSVIELETGARHRIDTAGTDVTRLQWLDERRLGFLGLRRMDSVAGIAEVPTETVTEVFATGDACGGSWFYPDGTFTADGRVVTIRESYALPQELISTDGSTDTVLGSVAGPGTDYLSSVAGTARPVTWRAADGLEIDGMLCTPRGEGPHPLVVNVHGGPIWAFRNTWSLNYPWVPLLVAHGYAVLNPNPRGSGGRGQKFAEQVVGDMGGADTGDFLAGIDWLAEQGIADPERVGLIGGSYGGFMSSWLVTQDQRFAAAVPIAPVTDWYSQSFTSNINGWGNAFLRADPEQPGSSAHTRSPVLQASKVRTPCLNVAGARDRCTPPGQALEFHHALLDRGVESALVVYPGEGHGVRAYPAVTDLLTRILGWFTEHMPPNGH
ncbi:alpha/beta hydrolase family protein [Sciscionella sediminilitoris]|uniref:alpha/beta hydrolase family protein n=1 Tax=Sciscionella sediminilitoris TaxID=1445613 RepID=UPI0004DF651C|nr:S9 family peptidase [Sciscionella sp. SE31]